MPPQPDQPTGRRGAPPRRYVAAAAGLTATLLVLVAAVGLTRSPRAELSVADRERTPADAVPDPMRTDIERGGREEFRGTPWPESRLAGTLGDFAIFYLPTTDGDPCMLIAHRPASDDWAASRSCSSASEIQDTPLVLSLTVDGRRVVAGLVTDDVAEVRAADRRGEVSDNVFAFEVPPGASPRTALLLTHDDGSERMLADMPWGMPEE